MSVFPRGFALAYGDGDLVDGFYKGNWGQTPGLPQIGARPLACRYLIFRSLRTEPASATFKF